MPSGCWATTLHIPRRAPTATWAGRKVTVASDLTKEIPKAVYQHRTLVARLNALRRQEAATES
jgi:hypothetical protein